MSDKKRTPSTLAAAVEALEDELLELDRHTEAALKPALNSEKHLQQVGASLQAIGGMEARLREAMGRLMGALTDLGTRQQKQMDIASARASELQTRHEEFQALMKRYGALGVAAQDLQGHLAKVAGEVDEMPTILEKLAGLVAEAEGLEAAAGEKDFTDLVRHARSLRQQLASAHVTMARRMAKAPVDPTPREG